NRRDALPTADAHGDERVALLRALQLVERLDGEDAAGGADRMAERYRTAVRVDLRRVEPEVLGHRHRLYGECLVRFDHIHVRGLEPRLFEYALHRRNRPETHELRVDAGMRVGHEPRYRLLVLRRLRVHQHDRRGRVVDARG